MPSGPALDCTSSSGGERAQPRILIVEDEFVVACDLCDTLEDLGYAVVDVVASGEEAIARARSARPSAILMDIRLAGEMDGIQAAARIRSEQDVPIVFLSAHSSEDTLRRATATDPFGYLVKPFKAPELRCAIQVALNKHEHTTRLATANRELEAFSHSVAHDLCVPLRSIQGFSEILIRDHEDALGAEGVDHLTTMHHAAHRMRRLIDDLMRLSRTNRAELHRAPVDLAVLARASLARLAAAEPARRVAVEVADAIVVLGDEALLAIALDNLLGNAWKFTSKRAQATIQVGTARRGGAEVCFVRDDGVGFDLARAGKLFSAFQRFHSSAEFDGTGLGLAIVHRVIQRHGGRIWAETAVDAGAAFYFALSP